MLDTYRSTLHAGSKSFALASYFLGDSAKNAATTLYAWCRYCDDQIDCQPSSDKRSAALSELQKKTLLATQGIADEPLFASLSELLRRHEIPAQYPLELIEGMAMDVRGETYADFPSLELYCYRVAGTVGVMMSHLMGARSPEALKHAADLGIAMQLTNISRDVHDDARLGRIYLPLDSLRREGIGGLTALQILSDSASQEAIARVVASLLDRAEGYYASGRAGLRYLPFRCAWAISIASALYRSIGLKVRRRGANAWETRSIVGFLGKLFAVLTGSATALTSRGTHVRC